MSYWVVMFDRDGGEDEPAGPFDCLQDAQSYADSESDNWRWVTYEVQEGDEQ
jgi:hypothetical protein